jgi:hypothetical protein
MDVSQFALDINRDWSVQAHAATTGKQFDAVAELRLRYDAQ